MQALGYGWLFFYWRNILAWSPSVEQKPKECELKNISSTSGKLGLFWVRQPWSRALLRNIQHEEMQGSVSAGMGTESTGGAESSDSSYVNPSPVVPDPSWLNQLDSSCSLLVTSHISSPDNPFLFSHINQVPLAGWTHSVSQDFLYQGFFSALFAAPLHIKSEPIPTASSKHEHIHRHKYPKGFLKTKYITPRNFWSQY